jgi:hypothetical protein
MDVDKMATVEFPVFRQLPPEVNVSSGEQHVLKSSEKFSRF